MIDRWCDRCGKRKGTHFRSVGQDPNRFTYGKMEWWCNRCENDVTLRVENWLDQARRRRIIG